ncbi:MAG: 5-oxoprolinase subunit PxpB, partial [Thermomicrobiales bacterium]|nr:5-oxoprolinase subunit PxpB [Thermomicrobiales bacterium]
MSGDPAPPRITLLAESALLATLGDVIDPALNARALTLAAAIDAAALPGVQDVVPSYTTVLVCFDPAAAEGAALARRISQLAETLPAAPELPARERVIPVRYGGAAGPDLPEVAAHTGLTPDEVIARHAAAHYRVACMGFCPGFAFLLGLPPELATPRRATPRTRVPIGSVAIGGAQTGVYPLETPGGWNAIGVTDLALFDLSRPDPFYLRPGDAVRFVAVTGESDARGDAPDLAGAGRAGSSGQPESASAFGAATAAADAGRAIALIEGGAQTTVQDLGRPGSMRFGVTPGGALDRRAHVLGNRLLGNDPAAAALEIALLGPRLRFACDALFAVTGADLGPTRNGEPVPMWEPVRARPGDELAFTHPARPGQGVRAYVCFDGGVAVTPVLGSRATDLFGRLGGVDGRALRAGDRLPLGPAADPERILRRRLTAPPPTLLGEEPVRLTLGPQDDRFTEEAIATLLGEGYTVSARSDRMGLRLSGPPLAQRPGPDPISEGIAAGAIQVPGDGQPIALLPARQTVGGYPKIATIVGADLDRLGQAAPGDAVRFMAVTPAEARTRTLAARAALGDGAVTTRPPATPGWRPDAAAVARLPRDLWTPEAVERIVSALRQAGVTRFRLQLAEPPLTLEYERA